HAAIAAAGVADPNCGRIAGSTSRTRIAPEIERGRQLMRPMDAATCQSSREPAMMRGVLLILSAVALVAATDAAPAAPRGGVVIVNGYISAGNATRRHFSGFVSRFSAGTVMRHATQAKPGGQIRSQMMFSVGHLN